VTLSDLEGQFCRLKFFYLPYLRIIIIIIRPIYDMFTHESAIRVFENAELLKVYSQSRTLSMWYYHSILIGAFVYCGNISEIVQHGVVVTIIGSDIE